MNTLRATWLKKPLLWTLLILALLVITALPSARRILRGHPADFTHLWLAAEAMRKGQDIYSSGNGYYIYPPLTAFLLQPLTLVSQQNAAFIWLACNVGLTALAVFVVGKEAAARWLPAEEGSLSTFISAAALLLTADKLRSIFILGQIDCLMLLGFALALCWMDRRSISAGLAVGAAANIKYLTLILVPWFLWRRNYRAAAASVVSFAFFLFLPAVEVGWPRALDYARVALAGVGKLLGLPLAAAPEKMADIEWDRSVSLTSAIFRMTRTHQIPDWGGVILMAALLALLLAAVLLLARRNHVPLFRPNKSSPATASLEFAVLVFVAFAFSPHTTARQMVLVLLIFALALAVLLTPSAHGSRWPLAAGIAIMTAGLSFPPFGVGVNEEYWRWREIGGAAWCAAILILTLVWTGSRALAAAKPA